MKIILKPVKLQNILGYTIYFCLDIIAIAYCVLTGYDSGFVISLLVFSIISSIVIFIIVYSNYAREKDFIALLNDIPYIEYDTKHNEIYVSKSMYDMGDISTILTNEIQLLNSEILTIESVLANAGKVDFPKGLVLALDTKRYKVEFTRAGSKKASSSSPSDKIFVTFIDISDEFAKYIHIENSYKQVRLEKEFLSHILDNIPVSIWSRNKEMEIVYFNNAYSNMVFGHQTPFNQEFLEIDKSTILSAKKAILENAVKVSEKAIIIDGKRYMYQITDIPNAQNSTVTSVAWDVSNKELLQKEMQDLFSSHQNLLESSSNACMIIGPDGKLKYFNDALVKFWGADESLLTSETTHEEILDHLYTKRKLPEQYNYAKFKKERTSLSTALTSPREDLFYLPDGKCLRCVVIPHAGNSLLFTYEDVTEKLSLERLNNTLSAVQKFTIDNLQEGICVFNESGELELVNAVMNRLWGFDIKNQENPMNLEDMIGKILGECDSEAEAEELRDAFTKVMVSRISAQQTIKNFDGNIIHRAMTPLPNRGIMVSDLDVTDSLIVQNALVERNESLIYVDKLKSEFLANMSYELRTPLTSILGLSQLLLSYDFASLSDSQRDHLSNLVMATEDLSKLVDNAIEITTINAGYTELTSEEFDLNDLIRSVISTLSIDLSARSISCGFMHYASEAIYVSDSSKIAHAITKLLENSIYRSKNVSRIDIDLKRTDDKYILSVTDDGLPVHSHDGRETDVRAPGLRYILARAIIGMLSGKIVSKYSAVTGLSSFVVELPVVDKNQTSCSS